MLSKSSFFKFFLSAVLFFATTWNFFAQVRVTKKAGEGNPSLKFTGLSGNSRISAEMASALKNCGWFNIISGNAEYAVGGNVSGPEINIRVTSTAPGKGFSFSERIRHSNASRAVYSSVDRILKKLFNIKGICRSRIAFCLELRKGIKNIYTCDFDGSNFKQRTSAPTLSVEPDWIPGHDSIVYTMYRGPVTEIIEKDFKSDRSRRLAFFKGLNSGGAISPDRKKLAMILSRGGRVDLYVKYIIGRGVKRLTNSTTPESSPCWSPDGSRICFVSGAAGNPKLYVTGANGGRFSRLPAPGLETVSPDWSSDGKIAYSARMGRHYTISVYDTTGKSPAGPVISAAGDWESPSWAPDNRHVVCSRKLNGRSSIYVIDTWTGKAKRLLSGKYNLSMPAWSDILP